MRQQMENGGDQSTEVGQHSTSDLGQRASWVSLGRAGVDDSVDINYRGHHGGQKQGGLRGVALKQGSLGDAGPLSNVFGGAECALLQKHTPRLFQHLLVSKGLVSSHRLYLGEN